jgi:hypothetical protein
VAQVLGVEVAETAKPTTVLRQLLALVGCKLEAKRQRIGERRVYAYRVVPMDLPAGADHAAMVQRWREQLRMDEQEGPPAVFEAMRAEVFRRLDAGEDPATTPYGLLGRGWADAWQRRKAAVKAALRTCLAQP